MSNNNEQLTGKADTSYNPTRTRAIDGTTIAEIARLTAKMLTESEACRRLGINPRRWFDWKTRHSRAEKFAALLEEFRAGRIDSLIAKIEASADGIGLKGPDWRAAAFLLSVSDKHRFGTQADITPAPTQPPMISEKVLLAVLDKLFVPSAKPVVEIAASVEPRQLPDAKP